MFFIHLFCISLTSRCCFQQVFRKLDPNKSGVVNLNNMRKFYCTKKHPKVVSGNTCRLSFQTSNSSIPFWHASVACQTSLAEPWFTFWQDMHVCCQATQDKKAKDTQDPRQKDLVWGKYKYFSILSQVGIK